MDPVRALGLRAPSTACATRSRRVRQLAGAGIDYAGWLPNYRVPDVFARYRATVHVPRRPYVQSLPGIPTIRMFEALACGIPLASCWWDDCEHLFRPGADYLVARTPAEMRGAREHAADRTCPRAGASGLETIHARHTCAHRVDELLEIVSGIRGAADEKAFSV